MALRLGGMSYYPEWPWLFDDLNITVVKSTMSLESGLPEHFDDGWWEQSNCGHLTPVCDIRFHHSLFHNPNIERRYLDF